MKVMQLRFVVAGVLACVFLHLPLAAMDMARVETGVDAAVSRFGVSGQGVIVALLDRGIDWKNDDFRNDDGTTRIKWESRLRTSRESNAPGTPNGEVTPH